VQQKGKILVVDDDRLVLATLTHGLAQAGYEVIDADNGDDAILLAREHKPELALLDIRMEGKSGFDVAAYLREYCQIPFMFLSAFSDDATVSQVKSLGALSYLVKPLDIQQIVPAVEAAFANRPKALAAVAAAKAAAVAKSAPVADLLTPLEIAPAPATALVTTPAAPATSAASGTAVMASSTDPLTQLVSMAVGVVMHRHSLGRQAALARLRQQANTEGCSVEAISERLLNAQEVLAGLGSL
jgi:DNA-binding response OmpR family regulator